MKKSVIKQIIITLLLAAMFTALMLTGWFSAVDGALGDTLRQSKTPLDGEVMLIGIDQRALEQIGPFNTWSRDIMAQVIEKLNADPDNKPAAIAIDTTFTGATTANADEHLASAAGQYGNVIMASMATFGKQIVVSDNGSFFLDTNAIDAYDEPYQRLLQNSQQGHINAMYDSDGVLRRCILNLELPDGRQIPSLNYAAATMYARANDIQIADPPLDVNGRWYLSYQGMPGDYNDGYSIADVLNGEITGDMFAGKIVIIGPYAIGLNDTVTAAIDHSQDMYGVEYQANAISAILAGDYKQEVPVFLQAIVLFIISFGCGIWFYNRKIIPGIISWAVLTAASLFLPVILWNCGLVYSAIYLPLSITILFIGSVAVNYVKAAKEKRRVTATFNRYVAPEIVTEILKEGSDALGLGGKLCNIAVLFVDIRGFTTMSELLDAPQVVEILNKYLTLTSKCIFDNNGTLDKFVGDCTMAFWGAPLAQEDCIFKAVKTALDMVDGSKALSEELQARFGRTVSFGIGVHYGPAVVGNIGAPNRMDYTAIGDTVNTSARLEANAPGGKVLVSRVVADALENRVRFTSLGTEIKLKGKSDGFEILTADGLA